MLKGFLVWTLKSFWGHVISKVTLEISNHENDFLHMALSQMASKMNFSCNLEIFRKLSFILYPWRLSWSNYELKSDFEVNNVISEVIHESYDLKNHFFNAIHRTSDHCLSFDIHDTNVEVIWLLKTIRGHFEIIRHFRGYTWVE